MRRKPDQTSDLESQILKHVRASGGVSRAELARTLGVSASTAGVYVERLVAEGFLTESAKVERDMGRPPTLLQLNPQGGEFIGIDFEARSILAVAVDFSDQPLRNARCQLSASDSATDVIRKIERMITEVLPADPERLLAIGVGVPGQVNSADGIAVEYKYISGWRDVPLSRRLTKAFGVPVFLENNVRSMALAELWFGQGVGVDDFLCIGIRSGVGLGLILDRKLYCGSQHRAGQFGRVRCSPLTGRAGRWFGTPDAGLGLELHEVASLRAIQGAIERAVASGEKSVLARSRPPVSLEDIVAAAQQRDTVALAVIDEAALHLGRAVANLVVVFDPRKVILAGPLTRLGDVLVNALRSAVEPALSASGHPTPPIVNSTMGDFSGALGAAALAVHQWKPA